MFRRGGAAQDINLQSLFRDPDVTGSAVRISVRLGATTKNVDIALYDQQKPITVANFLAYVNSGRYAENFFHRSVPGFIVQGGGFSWTASGVNAVPTYAPIQNEPGISNLRGTVAMAKLGGDPNSATGQWFVNLANNAANLDAQNGGFTVFGRVVGNGMAVMDEVAQLPRVNAGGAFTDLPVKDFPGGTIERVHVVETNAAVIPTLSFSATSDDPTVVNAAVVGSTLRLIPAAGKSGSTMVTVFATDLDGASVSARVAVKVVAWHAQAGVGDDAATFVLDTADTPAIEANPASLQFGNVNIGESSTRSFTVRNDSWHLLSGFNVTVAGANAGDFVVTGPAVPSTLPHDGSASFSIKFSPLAGVLRNATLRLISTNPAQASIDLALSGTGVDTIPPSLTEVTPQVVNKGAWRLAQVPDFRGSLVTATDNAGVVSFTQSPAPGTFLEEGEYPLIFIARDAAGNQSSTQSTLTVAYSAETRAEVRVTGGVGGTLPAVGSEGLPAGSFLSAFGTPAISDWRTMAARVTITAGRKKLAGMYWENGAGENLLIGRQGGDSGFPGATFKSFRDPLLSPDGAFAFAATLAGVPASGNEAVWTNLFGELYPVLLKGDEIPRLPGLKLKSITSLALQDDALIALVKLVRVPGLVTAANDTALLRLSADAATVLARTGHGFAGSTIKQISVLQPAPRSAGQGRWSTEGTVLAKLTLADQRTVIARLAANGAQFPLVQAGAPDAKLGTLLAKLNAPALGGNSIAVLATKARQAGVTAANDSVLLYAADGVNFTEVAAEGTAPGFFANISDPVANDQGEFLFYGTRRPSSAGAPSTTALFLSDGASPPEIVAQVGAPAADVDGQPLAGALWGNITSFVLPDGLGAGPVFVAQLKGSGVTPQDKLGLWALDSGGIVKMLLRTGQDVALPGGTKRLKSFTVLNALPGSYGARRSYNATGAVAVQATFTDGSQALLRLDVP